MSWARPGLNAAAHGRIVRHPGGDAAGVFGDVDIVALVEHIEGGPGNADFSLQPGDDDVHFA